MMKRQFGPGNTTMVMLMNGHLAGIPIKIKKKEGKMNKKKFGVGRQVAIAQSARVSTVGLCVNCAHQKTCTFPKTENKLFCEEYEI